MAQSKGHYGSVETMMEFVFENDIATLMALYDNLQLERVDL
jgi:hypothetical protein